MPGYTAKGCCAESHGMVNRTLDPSRRRSKTVWLCLTPGEWEALVEMSRDRGWSTSNILRDALRVYMVEHHRGPEQKEADVSPGEPSA